MAGFCDGTDESLDSTATGNFLINVTTAEGRFSTVTLLISQSVSQMMIML
jgi:hypothetical protein